MPNNYSQKERDSLQSGFNNLQPGEGLAKGIQKVVSEVDTKRASDLNAYRMQQSEKAGNPGGDYSSEAIAKRANFNPSTNAPFETISDISSGGGLGSDGLKGDMLSGQTPAVPTNTDFISRENMDAFSNLSGNTQPYADSFTKSFQTFTNAGIETPMNPAPDVANNVPAGDELGKTFLT